MARDYAKVMSAIWNDDDFRTLPPHAQHLYFVLLTDPDLSYCGLADWRPKRILPKANGWALDALLDAARILSEERLIVVDEDTEEVLVRSFLRHDGVMQHNKLCVSAMNAIAAIASNDLRGVCIHELVRLKNEFPDWPTWERRQVAEAVKRRAVDPASLPVAPGLAPGVGAGLAPGFGPNPRLDLGVPYNSTSNSNITTAPEVLSPRSRPKRHLPDDWAPTDKHRADARERGIDVEVEAAAFRNHAESVDRIAVNWNAAFSNWLLKAKPRETAKPAGMAPGTHRALAALEIGKRMQAEVDAAQGHLQIGAP